MTERNGSVWRVVVLALLAVAIWCAGRTFDGLPSPRGVDAPATEFSASRAAAVLTRLLGDQRPHPVSSDANRAVRDRIRREFAGLGMRTAVYSGLGCNGRAEYGYFACGTTEDVLAEVAPGTGKAIILLAHYDSVPAGPGAADDQSGVATVLETARALKARGMKTMHPIIAVITDGEEAGLLGAASFLHNPSLKARVGAVVNVEARGNQGPSLLFQTSSGDGPLIDLYAKSVPGYATGSLFETVYKFLPNDTDLTLFINDGFPALNFAFIGEVAHYHTALDRRENLSFATLQMHGDNMLGVASALMQTDFASLKGGDDIYLTIFGAMLPRLPVAWALPLAILAFLLLAAAAFVSRKEEMGLGRSLAAFAVPPIAIVAAGLFGWLLFEIAALTSGQPDPSYAFPIWLRIALAFGVLCAVLLPARLSSARMTALGVWFFFSVLAILAAAFLPGLSPYFLFPALIASALLLAQAFAPRAWSGRLGEAALLLAALPALVIWLSLTATTEGVQGLVLHPVFTVPAAIGVMTLIPLLAARPLSRGAWLGVLAVSGTAAILFALVAGFQPAFSSIAPQRLNIGFIDDHIANRAEWSVETGAPLPEAFRTVMPFSKTAESISPAARMPSYVAPAGITRFDVPAADVVIRPSGGGRQVQLSLDAPGANQLFLAVPADAGLTHVRIADWDFTPGPHPFSKFGTVIACMTRDCSRKTISLTFAARKPVSLLVGEQRDTIPPDGLKLVQVRPVTTVPSQTGDNTIILGMVELP